jgi:hypothetical protein
MEADWSVLVTSDFTFDDVAAASLVGSAGCVPMGLMGVVGAMGLVKYVVSDIFGVLGADKSSFLHPISNIDTSIELIKIVDFKIVDFFMFDSSLVG